LTFCWSLLAFSQKSPKESNHPDLIPGIVPALACIAKFLNAEMKCEPPWLKEEPQEQVQEQVQPAAMADKCDMTPGCSFGKGTARTGRQ
jgi:hypothetical protein